MGTWDEVKEGVVGVHACHGQRGGGSDEAEQLSRGQTTINKQLLINQHY